MAGVGNLNCDLDSLLIMAESASGVVVVGCDFGLSRGELLAVGASRLEKWVPLSQSSGSRTLQPVNLVSSREARALLPLASGGSHNSTYYYLRT